MVILGAVLFWHLATDEQVISANTHTTASN
jgi:hypothetical protein